MRPAILSLLATVAAQRYLSLPIEHVKSGCTNILQKRNAVCVPLDNAFSTYVLTLEIGTPPQPVRALVDTGSSDFVVLATDYIGTHSDIDREWLFNPLWSSSFSDNGTRFEARFLDGTTYQGHYGQDIARTNGLVIDNLNLAIATTGEGEVGIAGIGFPQNESPVATNDLEEPYSNLPMQLKEHGYILYTAYSLWLNSWSQEFGALIFGAIDLTCLKGKIYTFPIVQSLTGDRDHFAVKVSEMYLVNPDGRHQKFYEGAFPMVLDSGTAITRLPYQIIRPFFDALGVEIDSEMVPRVLCSELLKGGGIALVVNGVELQFSLADIAAPYDTGYTNCIPGFMISPVCCMGTNFLHSLYVVFDLEKLEIGMGMANTELSVRTMEPQILPITNGIPGPRAPLYTQTEMNIVQTLYDVQFGRNLPARRARHLPTITIGDISKQCLSWHCVMMEYFNRFG